MVLILAVLMWLDGMAIMGLFQAPSGAIIAFSTVFWFLILAGYLGGKKP